MFFISMLSLMILFAFDWFTTFLQDIRQSKQDVSFFLLVCSVFSFLPPLPLMAGVKLYIGMLPFVLLYLYVFQKITYSKWYFILVCSITVGIFFVLWTKVQMLFWVHSLTWLSWVQVGIALLLSFFLGTKWEERWALLFGFMFFTHLVHQMEAGKRGEFVLLGSPSFLEMVGVALFCFVIAQSVSSIFSFPFTNDIKDR